MKQKTGVVETLKSKLANLNKTADDKNTKFTTEMGKIKRIQSQKVRDINSLTGKIEKYNKTMKEIASKV